jgi:hypothetical protein
MPPSLELPRATLRRRLHQKDSWATPGRQLACGLTAFLCIPEKRSAVFLSVARADSRAMTPRAALLVVACALTAGSAGGARPNPNEARLSLASLRPEPSEKSHARAGLADWMAEDAASLYARTLHEVTLPGTHDSGAYWLTKQTIPDARFPPGWAAAAIAAAERLGVPVDEVITAWALTQSADVGAQLRAGFRYLDLRAGWNGTAWCVHHAEVGVPMRVVLADLAAFVKRHRGEFVVAQVSHLDGAPPGARARLVDALKTSLKRALRGHLVPVRVGGDGSLRANDTIGEMVARDERVLVVFGDGDYAAEDARARATPPPPTTKTHSCGLPGRCTTAGRTRTTPRLYRGSRRSRRYASTPAAAVSVSRGACSSSRGRSPRKPPRCWRASCPADPKACAS